MPVRTPRRASPAFAVVAVACLLLTGRAGADDALPTLAELEARGAVVGEITLDTRNIFNTDNPDEDKWLYRMANRIHVVSRPSTIRSQLLFRPGDPLDAQKVEESERILRSNPFIFDASVRPVRVEDGKVDFVVETRDNWTLFPELGISRTGGETRWQVGLEEDNLLGTGSVVSVWRRRDDDRASTNFQFSDRNLGRSWVSMDLLYRDSDDGEARRIRIAQPFYALTSRNAGGFDVSTDDREEPLFSRGTEIGRFRQDERTASAWWGFSRGLVDGWTTRWRVGAIISDNRFGAPQDDPPTPALPADRDLRYPFISIERVENRFEKVENFNQILQTEDLFLGRRFAATLGYANDAFGADRSALIFAANGAASIGNPSGTLLTLSGRVNGRVESGDLVNGRLRVDARYFHRQSARRTAFVGTRVELGDRLDIDNPITLGGDNGLRGYDRRFGNGDASAILTLEQRFFTDWYPWRLFRIGGAVFADVGRIWGEDPTGRIDDRWLADVGFGLRLGNARGTSNRVFHLDFAKPLASGPDIDSGLQISFEAKRGF